MARLASLGRLLPTTQWSKRAKLLLECRVECGKRGADPQRVHRASRHEVARRLTDANCGRRLALFWRRAKRNTIPFNSSKGRLMRFQVMRASAAALAVSVALAGAALAQQAPAQPAAPGAPRARSARRASRLLRRRSIWCRRSRNGPNSAPNSLPMARTLAPRCATSRPRPISRR